jgi:hypothetical protein
MAEKSPATVKETPKMMKNRLSLLRQYLIKQ